MSWSDKRAKPRSGRSQAKPAKPIVHHNTRARSKQAAVLALLSRPRGAIIAAMMHAGLPRDNQGENRATIRMRKAPGRG
jgi:hypothetical protein